ncbi:MAG: YceI family protein [Sulfurovum sp.]|jgi:polyisoprenoid-binding protein YceI|nr:YceI family protein [Sulfurovum sp.]
MKKMIIVFMMAGAVLFAYEPTNVSVKFTAFKTLSKIGVSGGFDAIELSGKKEAKNVNEMLEGLKANIKTGSVNSAHKERDEKLVNAFFNVQSNALIEAQIVSAKEAVLVVKITMNHQSIEVPMQYKVNDKFVQASGYIDLADFKMIPSLEGINKACYDLHEGKTWQDVAIEFSVAYQ